MKNNEIKFAKQWKNFYVQLFNIQVSFGRRFFDQVFEFSTKEPENLTFILLFRKIIELAYGQSSLTKCNEFLLLKSLNREAFETSLFLRYISQGNMTERALAYQIEGIRDKISYYQSLLPGSNEFKIFNKTFEDSGIPLINDSVESAYEVKKEILRLESILQTEPLLSVYQKNGMSNKQKKWYSVDIKGINSIKDLSESLNYGLFYHNSYKDFSGYIHGYNLNKSDIIVFSNEKLMVYEVPAPPLNLVDNYFFFNKMFVDSILCIKDFFKINPENLYREYQKSVDNHFSINGVQKGENFILDNNQIKPFSKKKR